MCVHIYVEGRRQPQVPHSVKLSISCEAGSALVKSSPIRLH